MPKNKKASKIILALTILAVIVMAAIVVYRYYRQQNPSLQPVQNEADFRRSNETNSSANNSNTGQQINSTPENDVNPNITTLTQENQVVVVRTVISKSYGPGECTITFEKNGSAKVTRQASFAQQVSYYTCQGFDIERGAFDSPGEWTATLTVKTGSMEAKAEPKTLVIY